MWQHRIRTLMKFNAQVGTKLNQLGSKILLVRSIKHTHGLMAWNCVKFVRAQND